MTDDEWNAMLAFVLKPEAISRIIANERERCVNALESLRGKGSWGNTDEDRGWEAAINRGVQVIERRRLNSGRVKS